MTDKRSSEPKLNMKIAVITQYLPNHQSLADLTSANKKEYCDRHGYDFIEVKDNYNDRTFDFQRVWIIYDRLFYIDPQYDVVWWLGCDTMIMNHTIPLTKFMEPADKSIYIHKDINGINNDSVIYRRDEWSKSWLEFSMSKYDEYKGDCWESQRVMHHFMEKEEWVGGVKILDHPGVNSYDYTLYNWPTTTPGHFNKGDFVLHLPGCSLAQRLDYFKSSKTLDNIIK